MAKLVRKDETTVGGKYDAAGRITDIISEKV